MKTLLYLLALLSFNSVLFAQDLSKIGKKEKAFEFSGSIGLGSTFTSQQGINSRRVPFSWYINGSPTFQIYDVSIPFSFVWSEQERSFSQPFNKYGASPYYKWLTIHAGWRNIYFSDYTLSGATFLGGGIEIKPGKFRASVIYGKFRNKVTIDQENLSRFSYLLPSYERWGMGAKIGFGKGSNFTDLIFFRAVDIKDSTIAPSLDSFQVKPMENVSVGIKSNYLFFKMFDLNIDFALSAVTLDSRITDSMSADEPALKPLENIMVLNRSTRPFFAGNASLGFSRKHFRIKAEYRRVDPEYQTLGSFYIANDLQQITLSPTLILFKTKVILNTSYGIRSNNLLKDQFSTTTNRIGSAYLNFNPKQNLGFSLNYSNYGTDLNSGQVQLNDSILFSIVNQSFGGSFRISKTRGKQTQSIVLNVQSQDLRDNNIITSANTESNSMVVSTSYNRGNGNTGINMGFSGNFTQVNNNSGTFQLIGPAFNIRKTFSKSKINLAGVASFQQKIKEGASDGSITNIGGNANYVFKKKHHFGVMLNALFNKTTNVSIYTFNEQRASFRYSLNF